MNTKLIQLGFSPALPCVDCQELTSQGLVYPTSSRVWQRLPLCRRDIAEPEPGSGEDVFATIHSLQQLVTNRIQAVEQLQRRKRRIARAYVRLRRQHAHIKAQRALRFRLRRICQRWEEVWHD